MNPLHIWMAIVTDEQEVVLSRACASRSKKESLFLPSILEITDNQGNRIKIDLSQRQKETQK